MIKVIINADDLGKSPEVNNEIRTALLNGFITSSTILANTVYWNDVHSIVDSNPQASFGIHLNLTEGIPLSCSEAFRKYGIVDKSNMFTKTILGYLQNVKLPIDLQDAIYEEWDKQLDKLINVEKIHITHMDGHHHIHQYYALSGILSRLANKYNLKIVRRGYNYPTSRFISCINKFIEIITTEFIYQQILMLKNNTNNRYLAYISCRMDSILWSRAIGKYFKTDYFDSYEHFITRIKYGVKKETIIELMCHPGAIKYDDEYMMIKSKVLNSLLKCEFLPYSYFVD